MKEGLNPEQFISVEGSWEERFARLPESVQSELKDSWQAAEVFIESLEHGVSEEILGRVNRVEHENDESTKEKAKELTNFLGKRFDFEENMDPMQHEIAIKNDLVDSFLVKEENGEISSLLQSKLIELPPKTPDGVSEVMYGVWYVATDPEYKGEPVTRELFVKSFRVSLEKAKQNLQKFSGMIGETESAVEGLLNRYGNLKRLYYENKDGDTVEVPFEVPPEDESRKGVPEHFMARFFDDKAEIRKEDFFRIVDALFSEYTRPEFFTAEYLKFAAEYYDEDIDPATITPARAEKYRQSYIKLADKIKGKMVKTLDKDMAEDRITFMSRRERRVAREDGKEVIDWEEADRE